jgi:hypothetical protein
MAPAARRRAVVFAVPMIVGLVTAQRALLFASGVLFGVSLMGLIQMIRASRGWA